MQGAFRDQKPHLTGRGLPVLIYSRPAFRLRQDMGDTQHER